MVLKDRCPFGKFTSLTGKTGMTSAPHSMSRSRGRSPIGWSLRRLLLVLDCGVSGRNTAFTEGGLELSEFKDLKNPLIAEKADLEQKLAKVERGQAGPIEPLKNLIFEANQAHKWVFENNWLEMKSFLQKVGLNRQTRSQTLTVSFKKHWCSLAETTVAAQRATSESERNSIWWRRRELNPRP